MSRCSRCKTHYRELPDEQGDHDCPKCGLRPDARDEEPDQQVCQNCGELFESSPCQGHIYPDHIDYYCTACCGTPDGCDCAYPVLQPQDPRDAVIDCIGIADPVSQFIEGYPVSAYHT